MDWELNAFCGPYVHRSYPPSNVQAYLCNYHEASQTERKSAKAVGWNSNSSPEEKCDIGIGGCGKEGGKKLTSRVKQQGFAFAWRSAIHLGSWGANNMVMNRPGLKDSQIREQHASDHRLTISRRMEKSNQQVPSGSYIRYFWGTADFWMSFSQQLLPGPLIQTHSEAGRILPGGPGWHRWSVTVAHCHAEDLRREADGHLSIPFNSLVFGCFCYLLKGLPSPWFDLFLPLLLGFSSSLFRLLYLPRPRLGTLSTWNWAGDVL